MRHRIPVLLITSSSLLFALLFATANPALGVSCTTSDTATNFDDWEDPAGWDCLIVPQPTDTVTIAPIGGFAEVRSLSSTVIRNTSTTISSLLIINSGASFTSNSVITLNDSINNSGVLTSNSVINSVGVLNQTGGTFTNNSTYYNNYAINISGGTFTNYGIINSISGISQLYTFPGGTLINYGTINTAGSAVFWNQGTIINCGTINATVTGNPVLTSPCPPPPQKCFTDGRLNRCDLGQTAAVYCLKDGTVSIYAIFNSKGYFAFTATPAEIAKVSTHPPTNILIKEKLGARLYRLTSGELQVNRAEDSTGKDYHFIFNDCAKPN